MKNEEIMTIKAVARYLKMTEKTIYSLAQKGKIPAVKIGGAWRFKKSLIDKWIEKNLKFKKFIGYA